MHKLPKQKIFHVVAIVVLDLELICSGISSLFAGSTNYVGYLVEMAKFSRNVMECPS
jgi:hypothetical protein